MIEIRRIPSSHPDALALVRAMAAGLAQLYAPLVLGSTPSAAPALEDAARSLGYARLRLDTGVHQHAALALYPSAGYCEIPDYKGNPYASYWGEKQL